MMKRVVYLFALALIVGCSSVDCPVDNTVATHYQILNSNGDELEISDTMTVVSTRADGKEVTVFDTVLYNKGIDISEFTLPISYSHPEDVLVFQFDNSNNSIHVKDTVWLKKEDYPHFESVDCNTTFFHTLTDVKCTHHYIDSIVINNPKVNYDSQTVHLFLYPKSND